MKRERGTYTALDNRVLQYVKTHWDASSAVLTALAERANYRNSEMKVPELMLETGLGQRAVEKILLRLQTEGMCTPSANGWTYQRANGSANGEANPGANREANDGANREANDGANGEANDCSQNEDKNNDQNGKTDALKEVERNRRNLKDKNTPLTPQGVMPEGSGQESAGRQGEAGVRPPHQDSSKAPQQPSPATDLEEVPRRAAAPALPDDLAALPGMPEAWERWRKHAREIRLQLKESTAQAQFAKLRALHAEGRDLPQHVDHAIEVGWRSFYPIKGGPPGRQQQPAPQTEPKPRTREEWLS